MGHVVPLVGKLFFNVLYNFYVFYGRISLVYVWSWSQSLLSLHLNMFFKFYLYAPEIIFFIFRAFLYTCYIRPSTCQILFLLLLSFGTLF